MFKNYQYDYIANPPPIRGSERTSNYILQNHNLGNIKSYKIDINYYCMKQWIEKNKYFANENHQSVLQRYFKGKDKRIKCTLQN